MTKCFIDLRVSALLTVNAIKECLIMRHLSDYHVVWAVKPSKPSGSHKQRKVFSPLLWFAISWVCLPSTTGFVISIVKLTPCILGFFCIRELNQGSSILFLRFLAWMSHFPLQRVKLIYHRYMLTEDITISGQKAFVFLDAGRVQRFA